MQKKILLVGNPNVGKSALFQALSGQYVEISNYPGTTVDLSQTQFDENLLLIDTPGAYSLSSFNDEERITKEAVQSLGPLDLIVNVTSAIHLERDLFLTLQLVDCKVPFVLVINQIDEAERRKISINYEKLFQMLRVKVFPVSAVNGEGIAELQDFFRENLPTQFAIPSPEMLAQVSQVLQDCSEIKTNLEALLWLEEDSGVIEKTLQKPQKGSRNKIYAKRRDRVNRLLERVLQSTAPQNAFLNKLNEMLLHPILGTVFGIIMGVFFLYQVLGVWVAGDLVNILENGFFEKHWNTNLRWAAAQVLPSHIQFVKTDGNKLVFDLPQGYSANVKSAESQQIKDLMSDSKVTKEIAFSPADLIDSPGEQTALKQTFVSSLATILLGKYGLLTLTVTYLLGVLLPLVWFFYLSWALFEDSGYLPRLAVLADGFLRKIGLNGRGIIPLVLGLGCVTMAVVTTRLMSSRREQLILMILLGIAVPCSAQLGIIQGLLAKTGGFSGWLIWVAVIMSVLVVCGLLASKLLKGAPTPLLLELPPLRLPRVKNLLNKANQKSWFFLKESGVAFFWASLVITVFQVTGILTLIIDVLKPMVTGILHLPKEVALSFLLGMVRRDFGAFGLLDLNLTKIQAVTACVTLTLFVPCIATLGVMVKERNWKTALGIWLTSWAFGFTIGGLLTRMLEAFGLH